MRAVRILALSFAAASFAATLFASPTFFYSPPHPLVGEVVTFTNTSSDAFDPTYHWDFGDGSHAYTRNAQHAYMLPGTYAVILYQNFTFPVPGVETAMQSITITGGLQANFTFVPENPKVGETVVFTDASSGNPQKWTWTVSPGGAQSDGQSFSFVFKTPGQFLVGLRVENGTQSHILIKPVNVRPDKKPTANFGWSPAVPTAGQKVYFIEKASESTNSWTWSFGDGGTSTAANPVHVYANKGTFDVKLTVSDGFDSAELTLKLTVADKPKNPPIADFTIVPARATVGQPVYFSNKSSGDPTSYSWSFGDGGSSSDRSPWHTYNFAAGSATVRLTITNEEGTSTHSDLIRIDAKGEKPSASFTWFPAAPYAGQSIALTDTSTENPTEWSWSFDNVAASSSKNAAYTFARSGAHTVTLTARNAYGSSVATAQITVADAPENLAALFSWSPGSPKSGGAVQFTDTSTGTPSAWLWSFGDGSTSQERSPSHTYNKPDTYAVRLTVTKGGRSAAIERPVKIEPRVKAPVATFAVNPANVLTNKGVILTAIGGAEEATYLWKVDGVYSSSDASFMTMFSTAGAHTVSLQVENEAGTDARSRTVYAAAPLGPSIGRVKSQYGQCFFSGTTLSNRMDIPVTWNGGVGTLQYQINDGPALSITAGSSGGSFDLDTSRLKSSQGVVFPNSISFTAENADKLSTKSLSILRVYTRPPFLLNIQKTGYESNRVTFTATRLIPNPEWEAEFTFPATFPGGVKIPFVGGKRFGLKKTQATIEHTFRTDCTSEGVISGQTGFDLLDGVVTGEIHGKIESAITPERGIEERKASWGFSIRGGIEVQQPIAEAIPAAKVICALPLGSSICNTATVTGELGVAAGADFNYKTLDNGTQQYETATIPIRGDVKITGTFKISSSIYAQVWGGGAITLTVGVPAPTFRKLEFGGEFGAKYKAFTFEGEAKTFFSCTTENNFNCGPTNTTLSGGSSSALALRPAPVERGSGRPAEVASNAPHARSAAAAVENVFSLAEPHAAASSDTFVVFTSENPAATNTAQRTDIKSIRLHDGVWSAPRNITADSNGDFAPRVAPRSDGSAVAVWQRIKNASLTGADIKTTDDLVKLYREMEIMAAVYDPAADAWSSQVALTDNSVFDHDAAVAMLGDREIVAVWLRDPGNQPEGTTTNPTQIVSRTFDGTSWGAEQVVAEGLVSVQRLSLAASGSNAIAVWSRDKDGDLTTTNDREIAYAQLSGGKWSAASDLTSDVISDTSPAAAYGSDGKPRILWRHGSDWTWSSVGGTPAVVRSASTNAAANDAQFIASSTGAFAFVFPEAAGGAVDLFTRIWDPASASWSADVPLTQNEPVESNVSAWFAGESTIRVVALQTAVERQTVTETINGQPWSIDIPQPGRNDIVAIDRDLYVDLAVTATPQPTSTTPANGDRLTMKVALSNTGSVAVRDAVVELRARAAAGADALTIAHAIVEGEWKGGEKKELDIAFSYDGARPIVSAVVDPSASTADRDRTNNERTYSFANIAPRACIQASAQVGTEPLTVSFDASCSSDSDGTITAASWSFADGSAAEGLRASHTFTAAGTFPVTLTIFDNAGGSSVTTMPIYVATLPDMRPSSGGTPFYVTAVGRTGGAGGSYFVSDVAIVNPDAQADLEADAVYLPDGRSDFYRTHLLIPAGETLSLSDVVASAFSAVAGLGSMRIDASSPQALISAHTYNQQPSGTAGFTAPAVTAANLLRPGSRHVFLQHWRAGYRTNIGFTEVDGIATTVTATAFDAAGRSIGSKQVALLPYRHVQINGEPLFQAAGRIEVETSDGSIAAYLTTVDNLSGDPIYQAGEAQPSAAPTRLLLPVVGRLSGSANTMWRSDVRLYNAGTTAAAVTMVLTAASRSESATLTLQPGGTIAYDDVITSAFPQVTGDVLGTIIVTSAAPLLATSRTYNMTANGTFGLYAPGRTASQLLAAGESANLIQLENDEKYRCNLGIAALDATAVVRVRLYDGRGQLLGDKDFVVGPAQNVQKNIFAEMNIIENVSAARAELTVLEGGPVYAYASVVDNRTGDSAFVEIQR